MAWTSESIICQDLWTPLESLEEGCCAFTGVNCNFKFAIPAVGQWDSANWQFEVVAVPGASL